MRLKNKMQQDTDTLPTKIWHASGWLQLHQLSYHSGGINLTVTENLVVAPSKEEKLGICQGHVRLSNLI
jgi:hypothetical protein